MSVVFSGLQVTDLLHGAANTTFAPVRVATAVTGTLSTAYANGQSVDGVSLTTGDRILVKDQSTASENGIYEVQSSGSPIREADMEVGASANGVEVWVKEGTVGAGTSWICTSAVGSDVVNTNNLTFSRSDTVGTLSVDRGGSGATTHTSNGVLLGSGASAVTSSKQAPTGDFVGTTDSQTMSNKTLTAPIVSGDVVFDEATNDLTLAAADQTGGVGTFTIPDLGGVSGDAVVTNLSQNLTNKTLTSPTVSGDVVFDEATNDLTLAAADQTGGVGTLTIPDLGGVSGDAVVTNLTQTLTNKTLTTPVISSISNTGTLTLPTSTDTLVGRATTDTLTNKTWGDDLNMNNNKISNLGTPTADGDAATKAYADSLASGLDSKASVRAKTGATLSAYTPSGSGIGKTMTADANGALPTIDGVTLVDGDRLLVDDLGTATGSDRGIYVVTDIGDGSNPWILTRATDADNTPNGEVSAGMYTFVEEGSSYADSGFVLTTNNPIVLDTTTLEFTQFSGAGQISAGDGLNKSGNTMSVDLKANGGLVIDSTEIAIDLGASSITGTLAVADGGTGNTSLTSGNVLLGAGGSAVTHAKAAPSGDFVGTSDTQTLTNKTLTSPKIGTNILDTNGNELVVLTATGSAVNELTLANAATGNNPSWTASGGDTNIGMDFTSKGTGVFNFAAGSASSSAELRLADNTGGEYVALDVPASVTSYTMTLPSAVGAANDILRASDASGNMEFVKESFRYMWQSNKIVANTTVETAVAYFAWDDSEHSGFNTGKVIFWHNVGANRNLTVEVYDGSSTIGTVTITAGTAAGISTFTITNPIADKNLELRVMKSASGGANPEIFGVQLEFAA